MRPRPRAETPGEAHRLVFFDNGKLSPPYTRWVPIEEPILAALRAVGEVTVEREELVGTDVEISERDQSARRAQIWKQKGVTGVAFALCDAGVTLPTLLQAEAAEEVGIPTAVLCTEDVIGMARVAAAFMVDRLPLVVLPARPPDSADIERIGARAGSELVQGLIGRRSGELDEGDRSTPDVSGLGAPERGESDEDFELVVQRDRMGDGLPMVRPSEELVQRMLAFTVLDPDFVIIPEIAPSCAPVTVRRAAIAAVMAGCSPRLFPLVTAALMAMAAPQYRVSLAAITTHPGANLLLFSGPIADSLGVQSGRGCLGPGNASNLQIGRAVTLTLINVGRAIPGFSSLCTFGSPGQLACCFADLAHDKFPRLNRVLTGRDDATIVVAHRCESPHNVVDHVSDTPESLLSTIASVSATLGGNGSYMPSDLLVLLNPDHADLVGSMGWARSDIQAFLWEAARNDRSELGGRGVTRAWPSEWRDWKRLPVAPSPERIWIAVSGASGPHSMVAIPWGPSAAVWQTVDPAPQKATAKH
jgi:hypothetical protein